MQNIHALILTKVAPKHSRDDVPVGEHEFNIFVRLEGKLRVGEDYWTTPTAQLPILPIIAIALSKVDAQTRERIMRHIENAAETANDNELKIGETLSASISALVERVRERFRQNLPQVQHKGKCTFPDLRIEVL